MHPSEPGISHVGDFQGSRPPAQLNETLGDREPVLRGVSLSFLESRAWEAALLCVFRPAPRGRRRQLTAGRSAWSSLVTLSNTNFTLTRNVVRCGLCMLIQAKEIFFLSERYT